MEDLDDRVVHEEHRFLRRMRRHFLQREMIGLVLVQLLLPRDLRLSGITSVEIEQNRLQYQLREDLFALRENELLESFLQIKVKLLQAFVFFA